MHPFSPEALLILELGAVLLNVAFTLCIAWGKRTGWVLGFVAGVIGVGLYALAHTWAMSVLNGYYVVMAVYGWWSWGRGDESRIRAQRWAFHAAVIPTGLVLAYLTAVLLGQYLNGNFPHLDAFVTVFSFIATWMMARKYIGNWAYFIVADSVGIYLNWRVGYMGYAALNVMYLVLSVVGLVKWGKLLARQRPGLNA
ncbi:MAG TPA: nicotinamide riboside transporter PnuC [Flavobacteriales bacterium]|nr:nicotinamide riboside transporter PnuC [Flavobacteriales bacterium]HRO38844.1 nicotinamide riboside transporter PnuC [Flavobacteriales bacterium]HRP81667.1 nicotinamide riboside transporter PnuC [Flavobacteriales bacterium]HRQ84005.1 nicotinamide riboside transporter PnuC [Flavobacteriales bacterium]